MTLNGEMALILHYFTEFVYAVIVKQLLVLPRFQKAETATLKSATPKRRQSITATPMSDLAETATNSQRNPLYAQLSKLRPPKHSPSLSRVA